MDVRGTPMASVEGKPDISHSRIRAGVVEDSLAPDPRRRPQRPHRPIGHSTGFLTVDYLVPTQPALARNGNEGTSINQDNEV